MKPRFGLDLDGVTVDFIGQAKQLLDRQFGYNLPLPAYWDQWEKEFVSKDHWDWFWTTGLKKGAFRGLPYPGALAGIHNIAKLADIVVITSRPAAARADTFQWLADVNLPTSEVHILSGEPKSSIPCDFYLDDKAENCEELYENTNAYVMLWDRPWNQDAKVYHERVFDWNAVLDAVRDEIELKAAAVV